MARSFDRRTALLVFGAAALGVAWAYYNYSTTFGPQGEPLRSEDYLRALVWTIFAVPLATFLGWLLARRHEGWLAAGVCLCIYFFSTFVAARIESFFMDATDSEGAGHTIYFPTVIVLNLLAAAAVAVWRARTPAPDSAEIQPTSLTPNP